MKHGRGQITADHTESISSSHRGYALLFVRLFLHHISQGNSHLTSNLPLVSPLGLQRRGAFICRATFNNEATQSASHEHKTI